MVFLAENPSRPYTIGEISASTQAPSFYLAKVMQNLARSGLVVSQRGKTGGYQLSRSATETTVWDVVQAADPIKQITSCPLHRPDHEAKLCPLHAHLAEAGELIKERFSACKISDLV